jgi:ligand-binding sensor domain-containing protein
MLVHLLLWIGSENGELQKNLQQKSLDIFACAAATEISSLPGRPS